MRIVLAAVLLLGACDDPCKGGDTECASGTSLRRCNAVEDGFAVSYRWEVMDCPASNPVCVMRELAATAVPQSLGICATAAEPAPACDGVAAFCTEGERFRCEGGFAVADEICANGCAADGTSCAP